MCAKKIVVTGAYGLIANAVFRHLPDLERRLLALERAQPKPENS